jgi:hypothetical protein
VIGPLVKLLTVTELTTRQLVDPLSKYRGWVLLAGRIILSFTWAVKVREPPVAVVPPLAV